MQRIGTSDYVGWGAGVAAVGMVASVLIMSVNATMPEETQSWSVNPVATMEVVKGPKVTHSVQSPISVTLAQERNSKFAGSRFVGATQKYSNQGSSFSIPNLYNYINTKYP